MILYHALSYYQMLVCVVHSCSQNDNEKILLMTVSVKANIDKRELEKYFSKVIFIKVRQGLDDLEHYQEQVCAYFELLFAQNGIIPDERTAYYVGGAHYNFGVYLSVKKLPFCYLEEACGLLSDAEHVRSIDRKNRGETDLIDSLGLYDGSSSCIKGILCNAKEQQPGYVNPHMQHFDVLQEMLRFDSERILSIIKIFGETTRLTVSRNCVLFLSQHYANLAMMSYEKQVLLYGLVFDYFLQGKEIVIKRHPADVMAYEELYPKTRVMKEAFLSEFIPFLMKPVPEMIATISSTGIKPLRSAFEKNLEFDFDFEEGFESVHRVYISLAMALQSKETDRIACVGINLKLIGNLLEFTEEIHSDIRPSEIRTYHEINKDMILLADRIPESFFPDMSVEEIASYLKEKCPARAVLFLNSEKKFPFYSPGEKDIWNYIIPVAIEKRNLDEQRDCEIYNDFADETFYILTKDEKFREMAMEFKKEKQLEHMKLEIAAKGAASEEHLKIAILQGIVEATEQRLLHYMEVCKKQEEEIRRLKE